MHSENNRQRGYFYGYYPCHWCCHVDFFTTQVPGRHGHLADLHVSREHDGCYFTASRTCQLADAFPEQTLRGIEREEIAL